MTTVHSPSCHLAGVGRSLEEVCGDLSAAIEAIQDRVSEPVIDEVWRILGSLELATGVLGRLVDDIDSEDACGPEATETHGGAN